MPADQELTGRLAAVLAVVYLIFSAGWGGGRVDLAADAIRLGHALAALMPDEGEVLALLALMLVHDARRSARISDSQVVPLDEQDRSLWSSPQPVQGRQMLQAAITRERTGPYIVQLAIAELPLHQPRDWRRIVALYETLAGRRDLRSWKRTERSRSPRLRGLEAALIILYALELEH